jgi:hypothetical protein
MLQLLLAHRARFDPDSISKEPLVRDHLSYKLPDQQIPNLSDPNDERGSHRADLTFAIRGRRFLLDVAVVTPFPTPADPASHHIRFAAGKCAEAKQRNKDTHYNNLFLPSDNVKVVPIAMDFFGRMSKVGLEFIQYTVKQIVQAPEPSENRFSTDGDSNILLGKMMRTWYETISVALARGNSHAMTQYYNAVRYRGRNAAKLWLHPRFR